MRNLKSVKTELGMECLSLRLTLHGDVERAEPVLRLCCPSIRVGRHPERVLAGWHQMAHVEAGLGRVDPLGRHLPLPQVAEVHRVVADGAAPARPRAKVQGGPGGVDAQEGVFLRGHGGWWEKRDRRLMGGICVIYIDKYCICCTE